MRTTRLPFGIVALSLAACAGGQTAAAPTAPAASTPGADAAPAVASNGDKAAPASPCAAAERRQFDFWVGTWTVTDAKGTRVGTNRIELEDRDCVLTETWASTKGGTGRSLNYYDARAKEWVQLWVDGTGGALTMRGGLDGADMVLQGPYVNVDGSHYLLRGRWTPKPDGTVRQFFESSQDDGKTWKTWFDGTYTRVETAVCTRGE